jgi:IS30 family transposase
MDGDGMTFVTNWTNQEIEKLHRLKRSGMYFREIAVVLNRPYQAVTHKFYRTAQVTKDVEVHRAITLPSLPIARNI